MSANLALVGNPNVGKTALFNALTGLSQNTGNYPGVTVDRKIGKVTLNGHGATLIDLPGAYSLAARSPDEIILVDVLLDQQEGERPIDGLVVVVDASNLERNLYFVSQLLELGKPMIIALNMMDIAERRGLSIDIKVMSEQLSARVVPICAHKAIGIDRLKDALESLATGEIPAVKPHCIVPDQHTNAIEALTQDLFARAKKIGREVPPLEAFRVLVDYGGYAERRLVAKLGKEFADLLQQYREDVQSDGRSLAAHEARSRYAWVRGVMDAAVRRPKTRKRRRSEKIDNILTHKVLGLALFVGLMLVIFQTIYNWAVPAMNLVDAFIGVLTGVTVNLMPQSVLRSLITDGILAGVGSVIVFLPQILLLSLFIAILEDCGYMARAAFLMDKLLSWCGLSGLSFIPMMSSFACAIPGIMATRTIQNQRDRFTTILVAPLMSCSARLPIYLIMVMAFVPDTPLLGRFLGLRAMTLFLIYALGVLIAVCVAFTLKKTVFRGEKPPFILEMPSYKVPQPRNVFLKVYREGREFVERAGTLIFCVTIIVWALAYFPHSKSIAQEFDTQRASVAAAVPEGPQREAALSKLDHAESGAYLRRSFLGYAGRWVEPVFRPLGWDWRIATAAIASFPAREIVVATLGTLFNLGGDQEETSEGLHATLRNATRDDGTPLFNLPVALSIMVFFALCCQCGATLITIRRETGKWRWPALTFGYMTVLAYLGAMLTYQGTTMLGWGP